MRYEVLIPVSRGYPSARGRLPTRYSPVRRFPLNQSTEVSIMSFSLDLHVLNTPPAFILSQDQTLNECIFNSSELKSNRLILLKTLSFFFKSESYCFEKLSETLLLPTSGICLVSRNFLTQISTL